MLGFADFGLVLIASLSRHPDRAPSVDMSTQTKAKKPAPKSTRPAPKRQRKPKTFGEWAQSVAGIIRSGKGDLSTREGFGD